MHVLIRKIQPIDYENVLSLWNEELENQRVTAESMAVTYEQMRQNKNYDTFVALSDGVVVGFITIVQVLAAGFPVGYIKINGLAVKKKFQHKGIGTQLIKHVEQLAYQRGISNIGLASGFQRTDAHGFYEYLGFEKGSFYFSKMLY